MSRSRGAAPGSTPMAVARSHEWTTKSATSWTSSSTPRHVADGMVHCSLQRPRLRECNADRLHSTAARRNRVMTDCFALPRQHRPELRYGNARKQPAVHMPARDQMANQGPDTPFRTWRGIIPLLGLNLRNKVHIALADGVQSVHGVHGVHRHRILHGPDGAQGPGMSRDSYALLC